MTGSILTALAANPAIFLISPRKSQPRNASLCFKPGNKPGNNPGDNQMPQAYEVCQHAFFKHPKDGCRIRSLNAPYPS